MTTPSHYTTIALKLREVANLFDAIGGNEAPLASTTPASEAPAKPRGRPAKTETPASTVLIPKDEPKVDDTKVTAEHPERLKLKSIAKDLIAATDKATAQAAVKLFGDSTNTITDVQLTAACEHLSNLLKKKQATNDDV